MQQHRIFYSWQSDLPNKSNRGFIMESLERAVKMIQKDATLEIEPVIDRDTKGVAGSPDIANTIFDKIESCDIFICDVSIINSSYNGRKTPNPNILIELGYAAKYLGWERVILVMNTAFGLPEQLPFDLRMRRVIQYHSLENDESRSKVRDELKNKVKDALYLVFKNKAKKSIVYDTDHIEHDRNIFERANELMPEYVFMYFLDCLGADHSFTNIAIMPVERTKFYYSEVGNKYLIPEILEKTEKFMQALENMLQFVGKHFFIWPKPAGKEEYKLCLYPDLNSDRDGHGNPEETALYWKHLQKLFEQCDNAKMAYIEYRLTIKRNLLI